MLTVATLLAGVLLVPVFYVSSLIANTVWHTHLLASLKQTYRNPLTCIAAKWPYGGALHLSHPKMYPSLVPVWRLWDPEV